MSEGIYERIGRRIRAIRRSQELSLESLADRSGLTASYLGQIERVERKLSLLTVEKIAMALGVSPISFYSEENGSRGDRLEAPWIQHALNTLERLSPDHRALVLDAVLFLSRRQRRER